MRLLRLGHLLLLGKPGIDPRGIPPQALQLVVGAGRGIEDVDDDVSIVEQHPLGLLDALPAQRLALIETQPALDLVDQCLDLPRGGPGGNHEDIGDDEELVNVEQDNVDGLLVIQRDRGGLGQGRGLSWNLDVLPRVVGKVSADNDTDVDNT